MDKNINTIIAEIKLLNASGCKDFFLVEGRFDYNFWRSKKNGTNVEIIDCQGRENLEAVVFKNNENSIAKILGITDRDYDFFNLKPVTRVDDLIYTDFNDLETTILSFGIAKDIISALCNKERMANDGIDCDNEKSIFSDSLVMGKLRYISKKENHNFPFQKKYTMGRYYAADFSFDTEMLLRNFCEFTGIEMGEMREKLLDTPEEPLWHMLRGHDCLLNLYNVIQKYKLDSFKPLNIEVQIQCMFRNELLQASLLYNNIKNWERCNNCTLII